MIRVIKKTSTNQKATYCTTLLLRIQEYFLLLRIIATLLLTLFNIFTVLSTFVFYFSLLYKIASGVCKKCGSRVVTPLP